MITIFGIGMLEAFERYIEYNENKNKNKREFK
jgi:hypothetical protein